MSVLEKFQKYTPVAPWGATGLKCNFFFFKFATKSLEKKKGGMSPTPGATGPCRPLGGDRVLLSAGRHSLCHLPFSFKLST